MPEDEAMEAYYARLKHPHRLKFFEEQLAGLSPYYARYLDRGRSLIGLIPELTWGVTAYEAWHTVDQLHNAIAREHGAIGYEAYKEKMLEAIKRVCRIAHKLNIADPDEGLYPNWVMNFTKYSPSETIRQRIDDSEASLSFVRDWTQRPPFNVPIRIRGKEETIEFRHEGSVTAKNELHPEAPLYLSAYYRGVRIGGAGFLKIAATKEGAQAVCITNLQGVRIGGKHMHANLKQLVESGQMTGAEAKAIPGIIRGIQPRLKRELGKPWQQFILEKLIDYSRQRGWQAFATNPAKLLITDKSYREMRKRVLGHYLQVGFARVPGRPGLFKYGERRR